MDQPVPKVSRSDVERIVRRDFSSENFSRVLQVLDSIEGTGRDRVQLAVLKLADKDFKKLLQLIETAKKDFRDVLAWAEYPAYFERDEIKNPDERKSVISRDWKQYQQWLKKI